MANYQLSINDYPFNVMSEQLRSVEEILDDISELDQQLKELENTLSL